MTEETMMHVQDRPTPSAPALAPTRYSTEPVAVTVDPFTIGGVQIVPGRGLQGEFEMEVE